MPFGINILNTPAEIKKLPTYEPNQMEVFNQQLQQGQQNYDPMAMDKYAREQFYQQTVPQLSERFTASTGGRLSSPQFASQLGAAGAGLESKLRALRSEEGFKQLQLGLTPQYEYLYQPEKAGLAQEATSKAVGAFAEKLPDLAVKGIEAWGNRGKNKEDQAASTGKTSSQQAATTTEQILNNLTPPAPRTAADLVPQSTGNMAIDAFNNPSLTPFTRQALEKTKIQQPSQTANAVQQIGQQSSVRSKIGNVLGNTAMTTATTVPLVLSAVAAGAPAAVAIGGGLLLGGWNLFKSLRG